ncbi:MAG TPA: hypothetical protein PLR54_05225 [Spirochaetota bacterium]|jgi:hypothetical protein|nr:hypothetical protein [Spirochaetota bacterium]HOM87643.1 hypothetical protein [Spirochaetota bacterium]HQG41993.1 hypothetical protein [Spirochaetota bacterium]HQK07051.1 hypothetical protein [Spirochaetota bacterium]HRV15160.1 hypothetical protein [Spirochaetota bacterium]
MNYNQFKEILAKYNDPVVLIEGKRNIPKNYYDKAVKVGEKLAKDFPRLIFRTGNASGTDEAFSLGVKNVDPTRLQIVIPYNSHKKNKRIIGAIYVSPESLSDVAEKEIINQTIKDTPKYKSLIENMNKNASLTAKAKYLIRDTMKVCKYTELFDSPVAALFYVDLSNIESGGTGHTIRVCKNMNIPVIFQDSWENWI